MPSLATFMHITWCISLLRNVISTFAKGKWCNARSSHLIDSAAIFFGWFWQYRSTMAIASRKLVYRTDKAISLLQHCICIRACYVHQSHKHKGCWDGEMDNGSFHSHFCGLSSTIYITRTLRNNGILCFIILLTC